MCLCVDMYMCIYMIVSCKFMYILHLYVHYDYVQCCEDTISVELGYIN